QRKALRPETQRQRYYSRQEGQGSARSAGIDFVAEQENAEKSFRPKVAAVERAGCCALESAEVLQRHWVGPISSVCRVCSLAHFKKTKAAKIWRLRRTMTRATMRPFAQVPVARLPRAST